MPLLRRLARPLLAAVFVSGGVSELRYPKEHAEKAGVLLEKVNPMLDEVVEATPLKQRPTPETLARIHGGVMVGAGTLLALGKAPRTSAALLAGTLVPTTLAEHRFWEATDPDERQAQRIHFLKNIGLLGGLVIAAADTHGKPSLAWRGRHAAAAASAAVEKRTEELTAAVEKRAADVGAVVEKGAARVSRATRKADRHGSALQQAVDERAAAWQRELDRRAKEWAELADRKGEEWAAGATRRRAAWEKAIEAERVRWERTARHAAEEARSRAPQYAERLAAHAAAAAEQASEVGGDLAVRAAEAATAGRQALEAITRDARVRAAKAVAP